MRARLLGLLALLATLCLGGVALADGFGGGGGGSGTASLTRKTATDSSDQLVYTLDEAAGSGTFANTGALGATGNLTGNSPGTAWQSGYVAMLNTGALFSAPQGATQAIASATPASFAEYNTLSISAWVLPTISAASTNYVIVEKPYRGDTSWTTPYESIDFQLTNQTGGVAPDLGLSCRITISGTQQILTSPANFLARGSWHHVGCVYDGATIKLYADGLQVASTNQTGAVDYGTHGAWAVGSLPTVANGSGFVGIIDDVRVANVARNLAYFQTVWRNGMQIGGN